jgi:branched-chain amino acid transport system ATP-binding protein
MSVAAGEALLIAQGLTARYGSVLALKPTDIAVGTAECVAVLGPNGAGKSSLLRAIMGLTAGEGTARFAGELLPRARPEAVTARGVVLVPEGRGIFGPMTVRENLELGGYLLRNPAEFARRWDRVLGIFPRLGERLEQLAGSLSGGEQQMLAIGRALIAGPKLLLLDEPSLGLAPRAAEEILRALGELNRNGLAILLVEQKAPLALDIAARAYVMATGSVIKEARPDEIRSPQDLARLYFAHA